MIKGFLSVAAILAVVVASPASGLPAAASQEPEPEVLFDDLDYPTAITFAFGKMFVNERSGRIRVAEDGELSSEPLATIPVTTTGETGLLGIAAGTIDGEPYVYAFATEPDGATNSVWRVPAAGGEAERVVSGLPASVYHNGGGVALDRDGMLFVSNGEQHDPDKAQDPNVLGGKVYRYTAEGEVPGDNPFPGSPAYSLGHRNPFGLTIDPLTGTPWVSENGPESFDEINRIERGANYGWPVVSGPGCEDADITCLDPVLSYEEVIVPTGITFAPRGAPRRFAGDLFFGSHQGGGIHHVELDERRERAVSDEVWIQEETGIVGLAWGPEGLYYSTPDAVKLLPLKQGSAGPARPGGGIRDEGGDRGSEAPGRSGTLVLVGAVAVAAGLLALFFRRNSRR